MPSNPTFTYSDIDLDEVLSSYPEPSQATYDEYQRIAAAEWDRISHEMHVDCAREAIIEPAPTRYGFTTVVGEAPSHSHVSFRRPRPVPVYMDECSPSEPCVDVSNIKSLSPLAFISIKEKEIKS